MPECLTAEAVLSLPAGAELDTLVVERVFGGKVIRSALTGRVSMAKLGPDEDYGDLPPFSTDMTAAWKVVERLAGREHCSQDTRATGPTMLLAVCRAALLVVLADEAATRSAEGAKP